MSIKRFRPYYFDPLTVTGHTATMRENTEGDYVLYSEYERLEKLCVDFARTIGEALIEKRHG